MFYATPQSNALRLGDIVTGYVTAVPNQIEPIKSSFTDYNVDVKLPSYLVVLTPCCSIGDKTLSLVPIMTILDGNRKKFFTNPNFRSDMTLINLPHTVEEWRDLGHQGVTATDRIDDKLYTLDNLFIYAEDLRLPSYEVTIRGEKFNSRYYMIDFRNVSKAKCDCIVAEAENDPKYELLLEKAKASKILELSTEARESLRQKLSFYYRRIPIEDLIAQY